MSRHPSPGPSHSAPQISQQPSSAPSRRSRPTHPVGIAAGAEDVKYQAKYKDLKRKVKDIEGDNDKLQLRIMQAKRSLQRMKLERAILYERISSAPSAADPLGAPSGPPLPAHHQPSRSYSGSHQNRDSRDRPIPIDADPPPQDYLRRPPPPDPNRPMDPPPVVPSPHMSAVQSPRRNSAGHDTSRHLPPLSHSHLPPVAQYDAAARTHTGPAGSPPIHHAHPNSSSTRSQQQSSRPPPPSQQNYPVVPGQQYPESLPPVQRVLHTPPPPSDRDRDRSSRRIEGNDYPSESHLQQQHSRHHSQVSPHMHSADARSSSSRMHPHQRMGPGTYINREDSMPSRQYDLERERGRERDRDGRVEWERETRGRESRERDVNIHSPHATHRRADYPDHSHSHHSHSHSHSQHMQSLPPPRIRRGEEDIYYHDTGNPYPSVHVSRSDTPGSNNSGLEQGGVPSRPDSRTQYYEDRTSARPPSYRLRPVSQSNNATNANMNTEEAEFGGHDREDSGVGHRSASHEHARLSSSSTPAGTAAAANSTSTTSGPNNGTGVNTVVAGGGGGREAVYPPPPPPPLGSGLSHYERHDREPRERGQTPSLIEPSTSRKRNRNDMEMDIDSDKDNNHNDTGVSGGAGAGADSGSRRNTPAPGFSGVAGEDRDRGSSKRYQRGHPHYRGDVRENREGSIPPPPPPASLPEEQRESRMSS
ncbi:hypothetical protein D9756_000178 [Leucocoprinus leucothites]|uniref:INO80 complex subunit F domain-containing protein n=1 Tax=Leucocoprinus leucothites TaxID=201217 RepID=A0A8H5GEN4_9AGAR|nr:hypothetical protein D9756_000178 [Leucoagaricus leucothites]